MSATKNKCLTENQLKSIKKILVIQLGPFGDALLCTSPLETIKKKFPQSKLFFLVKEPYQKILLNHPFIDEIITIKKQKGLAYHTERVKTWIKIHKLHFDLVIDFQNKQSSQQIALFSGAKYRVGYGGRRLSMFYNYKATLKQDRYSASLKFDMLEPLGIKEEPYKLYFDIGEDARKFIDNWITANNYDPSKLICISPVSIVSSRQWLLNNFTLLADIIQTRTDLKVVLLWGPGEYDAVNKIKNDMKTVPIIAPPTDLKQAAALLKVCRLLICNNCGMNHLSAATKTPTVAVFRKEHTVWSPGIAFNHFHLCQHNLCPEDDFTFGFSPDDVFEEVKKVLNMNLSR